MRGNVLLISMLLATVSLAARVVDQPSSIVTAQAEQVAWQADADGISTDKAYLATVLDQFCQTYYYKCFRGREYADGTLSIETVKRTSDWEVVVEGRHTYLGRLGREYRKRPFRATILMHKGTDDSYTITFEKQSENMITNNTYWESTTQVFRYRK